MCMIRPLVTSGRVLAVTAGDHRSSAGDHRYHGPVGHAYRSFATGDLDLLPLADGSGYSAERQQEQELVTDMRAVMQRAAPCPPSLRAV